jgi:hypothetical protein
MANEKLGSTSKTLGGLAFAEFVVFGGLFLFFGFGLGLISSAFFISLYVACGIFGVTCAAAIVTAILETAAGKKETAKLPASAVSTKMVPDSKEQTLDANSQKHVTFSIPTEAVDIRRTAPASSLAAGGYHPNRGNISGRRTASDTASSATSEISNSESGSFSHMPNSELPEGESPIVSGTKSDSANEARNRVTFSSAKEATNSRPEKSALECFLEDQKSPAKPILKRKSTNS